MEETTDETTGAELHRYMLAYQDTVGRPPTMQEMVDRCPSLNYRSSARDALRRLATLGLVQERGEPNTARRWWAISAQITKED
jgi:hypothetical protein